MLLIIFKGICLTQLKTIVVGGTVYCKKSMIRGRASIQTGYNQTVTLLPTHSVLVVSSPGNVNSIPTRDTYVDENGSNQYIEDITNNLDACNNEDTHPANTGFRTIINY